jgi:hypothetical protein
MRNVINKFYLEGIKSLFAVVFITATFSLRAEADKLQLARLHYDGGGDWYNDSDTLPNIAQYLNDTINTSFSTVQAVVKPSDASLIDYPFIYMTGHGNIHFHERDIINLRTYFLKGGFLYADDDYGMDSAFRREIKKVFPEKELVELPASHPVFTSFFKFPKGVPKIHEHDGKRPQAFAIFDDSGRMMVFYTYETNISDAWTNSHDPTPEIKNDAMQMGANLFYYLLTQ